MTFSATPWPAPAATAPSRTALPERGPTGPALPTLCPTWDTHGQSAAIFGLAFLLGIGLMPRIRRWQDLHLFRPDAGARYEHIDGLFTATVE